VFGAAIEFEPIRICLVPGTPPYEPIMHAHIDAPRSLLLQVRSALQRRRVVLLKEDTVRARAILRGEGQTARLLGRGDELLALASGSILLWVAPSRYVPIAPERYGAGDGNRTHV
jgi:hypothetical protein